MVKELDKNKVLERLLLAEILPWRVQYKNSSEKTNIGSTRKEFSFTWTIM